MFLCAQLVSLVHLNCSALFILGNHKLECHFKGHQVVLLSERLQFDGKDVLVLDKENNVWISMQDPALTSVDIQHIMEECEEQLKKLSAPQSQGAFVVLLTLRWK